MDHSKGSYEYDGKVIPEPKSEQHKDMKVRVSIGDSTYDPVSGSFKNTGLSNRLYNIIAVITLILIKLCLI